MKNFPTILTIILATTLLAFTGCSSTITTSGSPRGQNQPAPPPAMIGHIIFIQLQNSNDYHTILHDADWMLGTIPAVATFAAGRHLDTGNSSVNGDYHLAIYLGFNNEQNLRTFDAHIQRIQFMSKWKPRFKSITVYDMLDWPTTRYGVRN